MTTFDTSKLEAMYKAAGLKVEIEAGPVGLVVYGASASTVDVAAKSLLKIAGKLDTSARADRAAFDQDEEPSTSWFAVIHLDWDEVVSAPTKST